MKGKVATWLCKPTASHIPMHVTYLMKQVEPWGIRVSACVPLNNVKRYEYHIDL